MSNDTCLEGTTQPLDIERENGSRERIRTSDPVINSHLLCQLSYPGISPTDSNCIDTLMPINAASFYIKNDPGLSIEPQTIARLLNNTAGETGAFTRLL